MRGRCPRPRERRDPRHADVRQIFLERRLERGPIWNGYHGEPLTNDSMARMRRTLQRTIPGFAWKRFRKTYATILAAAGDDVVMVSRLLRHSAGGKNVSIAQRHYLGRSDNLLRAEVDEAFEPYRTILVPKGAAAQLKAVRGANATG